jgi:acyl-CoA thioester hydrolase
MGVAHHASYVPWLEIGRTELLRQSGVSYAHLEAQGLLLVIVKLDVRYRRPVRYDDLIEVRTKWSGGSRVKILHEYEVHVLEPGTPVAGGESAGGAEGSGGGFSPFVAAAASTTLGCVNRQGSIQTLPDWLTPIR